VSEGHWPGLTGQWTPGLGPSPGLLQGHAGLRSILLATAQQRMLYDIVWTQGPSPGLLQGRASLHSDSWHRQKLKLITLKNVLFTIHTTCTSPTLFQSMQSMPGLHNVIYICVFQGPCYHAQRHTQDLYLHFAVGTAHMNPPRNSYTSAHILLFTDTNPCTFRPHKDALTEEVAGGRRPRLQELLQQSNAMPCTNALPDVRVARLQA